MKHTISAMVENKPGVLARMSGLFARRGFNIDSLAVSETENPAISRMTITVEGDELTLEQICNQLMKLIDVIEVIDHTKDVYVARELCLCKVACTPQTRAEMISITQVFRGDIVDVGPDTMIMQITGAGDKVDAFIEMMSGFGIQEMVRTGKILLVRGEKKT
jgi:acetolactate synthase I/III small subunit